jgi:DnaJ-class molecular chaperone
MARTIRLDWRAENDEGESVRVSHDFPASWDICGVCEGEGSRDHRAFRNGFTREEWCDIDDDQREIYKSDKVSVTCDCCNGSESSVL